MRCHSRSLFQVECGIIELLRTAPCPHVIHYFLPTLLFCFSTSASNHKEKKERKKGRKKKKALSSNGIGLHPFQIRKQVEWGMGGVTRRAADLLGTQNCGESSFLGIGCLCLNEDEATCTDHVVGRTPSPASARHPEQE